MIKKVFLALILANAAVLAYLQWGGSLTRESGGMQPSLHADKIKLLGFSPAPEASGVQPASAPAPVAVTQPPEQPASSPAQATPEPQAATTCLEWGEFSGADLTRAKSDLASLKLGEALTQREVEHSIGYWVYIPPLKSHAEVNARVVALKKHGIKDFFVVKEKGQWQNAISLNVFKTRSQAKKFRAHLRKKGVKDAVIGERQTRLKFTIFSLRNPDHATVNRLAGWQKAFTGITMKAVECK